MFEDKPKHNSTEMMNPEKFADFLVKWAEDPECNVRKLAREVGLPQTTANEIVKRLETRYMPVTKEVEKFTTKTILQKIETALPLMLDKLADTDLINKSTLREVAVAANILVDKRQLLRGEPTQIMSIDERKSLDDLAPVFLAEARRRGQIVDVEFEDKTPIDVGKVSGTMRHKIKREDRGRV
jgi:hypothetical protein